MQRDHVRQAPATGKRGVDRGLRRLGRAGPLQRGLRAAVFLERERPVLFWFHGIGLVITSSHRNPPRHGAVSQETFRNDTSSHVPRPQCPHREWNLRCVIQHEKDEGRKVVYLRQKLGCCVPRRPHPGIVPGFPTGGRRCARKRGTTCGRTNGPTTLLLV